MTSKIFLSSCPEILCHFEVCRQKPDVVLRGIPDAGQVRANSSSHLAKLHFFINSLRQVVGAAPTIRLLRPAAARPSGKCARAAASCRKRRATARSAWRVLLPQRMQAPGGCSRPPFNPLLIPGNRTPVCTAGGERTRAVGHWAYRGADGGEGRDKAAGRGKRPSVFDRIWGHKIQRATPRAPHAPRGRTQGACRGRCGLGTAGQGRPEAPPSAAGRHCPFVPVGRSDTDRPDRAVRDAGWGPTAKP